MNSPQEGNAQGRSPFCESCKLIDFDAVSLLFTTPSNIPRDGHHPGVPIATLGKFESHLQRDGSCRVCETLWATQFWNRDLGSLHHPPRDVFWELRAYPLKESWPASPSIGKDVGACLVAVPKDPKRAVLARDLSLPSAMKSYVVVTNPGLAGPGKPRQIPTVYTVQQAKYWMSVCENFHNEICNRKINLTGFRLIDCHDHLVVDAAASMSWVALSYVWAIAKGTFQNPADYSQAPPGSRKLPDKLPGIVLDAMKAAKSLGYRYIWVDRYCIDQDDPDHVNQQIAIMDRIFRGADLTIVAASDRDGLPGVGIIKRSPQIVIELLNGLQLLELPNIAGSKDCSKWSSRGWTYQEELLSRRRLYFTDYEMMFECMSGTHQCCWEGLQESRSFAVEYHFPTFGWPFVASDVGADTPGESKFEECLEASIANFWNRVAWYTQRDLTYQPDRMKAFQGIANTFEAGPSFDWCVFHRKAPLRIFYGLPSVTRKVSGFTAFESKVLVLGLAWRHLDGPWPQRNRKEVHAKAGIPSWSWLGWMGSIEEERAFSMFLMGSVEEERAFSRFMPSSVVYEVMEASATADFVPLAGSPLDRVHLHQPCLRLLATKVPVACFAGSRTGRAQLSFCNLPCLEEAEIHRSSPPGISPHWFMQELQADKLLAVLLGANYRYRSGTCFFIVLVVGRVGTSNGMSVVTREALLRFRLNTGDQERYKWPFEMSTVFDTSGFDKEDIFLV